eukprot:gene19316-6573_t
MEDMDLTDNALTSTIVNSTMTFVDLAGSERNSVLGSSLAQDGVIAKDGININKSLSMLAAVINSLANKSGKGFVNY